MTFWKRILGLPDSPPPPPALTVEQYIYRLKMGLPLPNEQLVAEGHVSLLTSGEGFSFQLIVGADNWPPRWVDKVMSHVRCSFDAALLAAEGSEEAVWRRFEHLESYADYLIQVDAGLKVELIERLGFTGGFRPSNRVPALPGYPWDGSRLSNVNRAAVSAFNQVSRIKDQMYVHPELPRRERASAQVLTGHAGQRARVIRPRESSASKVTPQLWDDAQDRKERLRIGDVIEFVERRLGEPVYDEVWHAPMRSYADVWRRESDGFTGVLLPNNIDGHGYAENEIGNPYLEVVAP